MPPLDTYDGGCRRCFMPHEKISKCAPPPPRRRAAQPARCRPGALRPALVSTFFPWANAAEADARKHILASRRRPPRVKMPLPRAAQRSPIKRAADGRAPARNTMRAAAAGDATPSSASAGIHAPARLASIPPCRPPTRRRELVARRIYFSFRVATPIVSARL